MTAEFWINLQARYDLKIAKGTGWPEIQRSIRPLRPKGKRNKAA